MKLTGKALKDFNNWLPKHYQVIADGLDGNFHSFDDSLKWGVYIDFFQSKGIIIFCPWDDGYGVAIFDCNTDEEHSEFTNITLPKARVRAIEKANEIYNSL